MIAAIPKGDAEPESAFALVMADEELAAVRTLDSKWVGHGCVKVTAEVGEGEDTESDDDSDLATLTVEGLPDLDELIAEAESDG